MMSLGTGFTQDAGSEMLTPFQGAQAQGTFANVWGHFWLSHWGWEVLLASSG